MNRWKKNILVIVIHLLLVLLCCGIVIMVGRFSSSVTETKPQPSDQETEGEMEPQDPDSEESAKAPEVNDNREEETDAKAADQGGAADSRQSAGRRDQKSHEAETEEEEVYRPPVLVQVSDIHYYPPELTDYGEAFKTMIRRDDGKVITYMPELLDAFTEEMVKLQPSAVVLSGDLTLNGEKAGHTALAEKLGVLQDKGIQVLVIPGNHDINHPDAAVYFGKEKQTAEGITGEEFRQIYASFGYDQAIARDEASLSYVYPLDAHNWLLMLDSAQYEPINKVGGRIREQTLVWMEQVLKLAAEHGIHVIPIAHHNLLKESILYPEDCTIENSKEVIFLLESYRVPVYLSGHLHLQRTKTYLPEPGAPSDVYHVSEIVADSMAIPPCQYGLLTWSEDGQLAYGTREVDVESWARAQGSTDENLLNFKAYGADFLIETISSQIYDKMSCLPEEQMEAMSRLYGDLNRAYCAGVPIDSRDIRTSDAFRLWERNLPDSRMYEEIDDILRDTKGDHNFWQYRLETKSRQEEEKSPGENEE